MLDLSTRAPLRVQRWIRIGRVPQVAEDQQWRCHTLAIEVRAKLATLTLPGKCAWLAVFAGRVRGLGLLTLGSLPCGSLSACRRGPAAACANSGPMQVPEADRGDIWRAVIDAYRAFAHCVRGGAVLTRRVNCAASREGDEHRVGERRRAILDRT
jgi:hypothetical protein